MTILEPLRRLLTRVVGWSGQQLMILSVNIQVAVAEIENNLRFPGQYYDQETGLYYNYNRYYDPETGKYVTPESG